MKDYFQKVEEAGQYLKERIGYEPSLALILSGGLEKLLNDVNDKKIILSGEIPYFPVARAEGHEGKLVFGYMDKVPIVILKGRYHYYEGHSMSAVVFPIFVLNFMGAKTLVVTNATGGINKDFNAGDIMLIRDQINMMGENPLRGITVEREQNQFPDMTDCYSSDLQDIAREAAKNRGIKLKEGVYIATHGPSYETKSEVSMFRRLGGDVAGMSVVPEITAANYLEMKTLGFSCIANLAADLHRGKMSHNEVLENMKKMEDKLVDLIRSVLKKI